MNLSPLCTEISFTILHQRGSNTAVMTRASEGKRLGFQSIRYEDPAKDAHPLCHTKPPSRYLLTSNYPLKENRVFYSTEEEHGSMQESTRCG